MKWRLLSTEGGQKTFAVVLDKEERVMNELQRFAVETELSGASFTGIGAFRSLVLGYFNPADYERIAEQVEVLSLAGNVALKDGKPRLHAHVVVGKSDGTAHGGHQLEGQVWPTLEVVFMETPKHLQRVADEETALPLLDLAA